MKRVFNRKLVIYAVCVLCSNNFDAQNFVITDTLNSAVANSKPLTDSSFTVDGEIIGIDSGSLKLYLPEKELLASVPFKQGKFHFSAIARSTEPITLSVTCDYYTNAFYLEPGQIKLKYFYQNEFVASGFAKYDYKDY